MRYEVPQIVKDKLKGFGSGKANKDWAYSLKSDYLDGVSLHHMQIQFASDALDEDWNKGICTPKVSA